MAMLTYILFVQTSTYPAFQYLLNASYIQALF